MSEAQENAMMEQALAYYQAELRPVLEPEHNGDFVAIDPKTGLYAVGSEPLALFAHQRARGSTSLKLLLRVGSLVTLEGA